MIRSFRNKKTELLFKGYRVKSIPETVARSARRKLFEIDAARMVDVLMAPPGNRLEKLAGSRTGQWSIRVNNQWRICFRWVEGAAEDVEFVDYH
jgi:toxin HigB-1